VFFFIAEFKSEEKKHTDTLRVKTNRVEQAEEKKKINKLKFMSV
jgi:hypothetical protein